MLAIASVLIVALVEGKVAESRSRILIEAIEISVARKMHYAEVAQADKELAAQIPGLLRRGADPNRTALTLHGMNGRRIRAAALHLTATLDLARTTQVLLDAGADVDCIDELGQTPLMWAAADHDPRIVGILLNAGANPRKRDHEGKTAIDRVPNHMMEVGSKAHRVRAQLLMALGER
jgi:hypothetical protein